MMNKQNLRDIKKVETAQALAQAAFELALERGIDGFVIDDIVHRAHYSKRTFANHFTCKEEAVAMAVLTIKSNEEFDNLKVTADTHPLDALHQWLSMKFTADLLRRLRELVSLSKQHPSLEPYILSVFDRLQSAAQESLDHLYFNRYPEGYTSLLVGAVFGAVRPIIESKMQVQLTDEPMNDTPHITTFEEYLDTTFNYLRNGF